MTEHLSRHTVALGAPLIRGLYGLPIDERRYYVLPQTTDVSYSVVMFGGYEKATVVIPISPEHMSIGADSIGRDIRIYNNRGVQVWEGFVNQVEIETANYKQSIGPLMDVANAIKLRYTELEANVNPPQGGDELETDWTIAPDDSVQDSIQRWGILKEIYTCPRQLTEEEAPEIAAGVCRLKADINNVVSVASGGQASVRFECLGYFQLSRRLISDYYTQAPDLAADRVLTWPFMMPEAAGSYPMFNLGGTEPQDGMYSMRLYNDQAESSYDFMESAHSVLSAKTKYGFMYGCYNERTLHFRENKKPTVPDIIISLDSGDVTFGTGTMIETVRPGMWARLVESDVALPSVRDTMFLVDNIEYSGGQVAINAATFSAIEQMLNERGV